MKTPFMQNLPNFHNITNKRFFIITLLSLCILWSLWLRMPYINVPILIVDEALYGEIANVILDGGLPYRDAWEQKPPAIYYLYAGVFALFGRNNLVAVHWAAAFSIALTCLGLFLLVSKLSTKITGLLSAFFYATLASAGQAAHFQAANTEIFSVLFCVWALYVFFRNQLSHKNLFLSGFLIGIGFFFKQPAGVILPVIMLNLLLANKVSFLNKTRYCVSLICGFMTVVLAVILYFLSQGALEDFFLVGFWHNILYMKDNDLYHGFHVAKSNIKVFTTGNMVFYAPSLLMFVYGIVRIIRRLISRLPIIESDRFYTIWYPASWFSVSLGWRFEGHYFFFVLPAIAVLSAHCWCTAFRIASQQKVARRFFTAGLVALLLIGLVISIRTHLGSPFSMKRHYIVTLDPMIQDRTFMYHIAKYIKRHTVKSDKIFVWGFCPEIYTMTGRRTASRFVFCNFLIGQMTGDKYYYFDQERLDRIIPGAWDKLMDDLHKNFPKYIIDTAPSNYFKYGNYPATRFESLKIFLDTYYTYMGRISYTDVYKLNDKKTTAR